MDRTDENPFQEAVSGTKQQKIDFDKLKVCTDEYDGERYNGLECGVYRSRCSQMTEWCDDRWSARRECQLLGLFGANHGLLGPRICQENKFWQDKPCKDDDYIRCRAGNSGQCVEKKYWGIEGAKDKTYKTDASCKDGSDLYRPIVKAEEAGRKPSQQEQRWKTRPVTEWVYIRDYKGEEKGANYTKDDTTGLWIIPESDPSKVKSVTEEDFEKGPKVYGYGRKEEWADFYINENYVKDETTNLMMAPTTEETCKANNGFVCKVKLDAGDMTSMIMMMTIGMNMAGRKIILNVPEKVWLR